MTPILPILAALLVAAHAQEAAPPVAAEPGTWVPSAETLQVHQALSQRDPGDCTLVEGLTATPVTTLLEVVEHATMPPWAPIRAAECLVRGHGAQVRVQMLTWIRDPESRGLAAVVYRNIDQLPPDLSVEMATAALTGADPDRARRYFKMSTNPAIRDMAGK